MTSKLRGLVDYRRAALGSDQPKISSGSAIPVPTVLLPGSIVDPKTMYLDLDPEHALIWIRTYPSLFTQYHCRFNFEKEKHKNIKYRYFQCCGASRSRYFLVGSGTGAKVRLRPHHKLNRQKNFNDIIFVSSHRDKKTFC